MVSKEDRVKCGKLHIPPKPDGTYHHGNSKYEPEFHDIIVELAREGASYAEMCVACGISKQTSERWIKAGNEDWINALSYAVTISEAYLNYRALENMESVDAKGNAVFRSELYKELASKLKLNIDKDEAKDEAYTALVNDMVSRLHKESV